MKKIGLLGGTFSPVHNGHVALAGYAYKTCGLDEVWFIPSGVSYMKRGLDIPAGEHRYRMVAEAVSGYPYFKVDTIELEREGNTYTRDTLQELQEKYPAYDFYFIIGDDTLFSMETWYHPEDIFNMCTLVTAVREHMDKREIEEKAKELEERYGARIILMDSPVNKISSTEIRDRVRAGESIGAFVPEAVEKYIEENHLYQK